MVGKTLKKSNVKIKDNRIKPTEYVPSENPLEFYISEKTLSYGDAKPFSIYYDEPEHSVRLLKGDCIRVLNQARENSVVMIFADPPISLLTEVSPVMQARCNAPLNLSCRYFKQPIDKIEF